MHTTVEQSVLADGTATIEAAPAEAIAAPSQDIDVTEGYQRWEFANPEAETGDTAPPPEPAVAAPAPEPEAKVEEPVAAADPDEAEIERILKHPNAQARIDQLANNRFGNRLQQERAAAEQKARADFQAETKRWDDATATYNRLASDDAYYAELVRENGEEAVLEFRANYLKAAKARSAPVQAPAFDATAYQQQFTQRFNESAIGEFRDVVKATLPFYGELPEDVRQRVERVAYDPNGNWLADAMGALGKGVSEHLAGLKRTHEAALREAVEAGKNEAAASREEATPLVVSGDVGDMRTWREIEEAYAEGRLPRAEFQAAKRKFGVSD